MARVRIHRLVAQRQTNEMASRLIRQVMYELEFAAKMRVSRGPYTTGELALSIHGVGPTTVPDGVVGRVGSDLGYARIVHDGAKVHAIFPKAAPGAYRFGSRRRPQLKFFWRKAGRVAFFPHIPGSPSKVGISHPGQPGKEFLSGPMPEIARRHNMRYIVYDV